MKYDKYKDGFRQMAKYLRNFVISQYQLRMIYIMMIKDHS